MTAAREDAMPDRERAETYLRLQAEAELRCALAMPQYKPSRDFRVQRAVQTRLMRRRRAIMDRFMRQHVLAATAGSQSGPASLSRAAQSTAAVLKAVTRTRYQLSSGMRTATWPLRRQFARFRGYEPPPAEACLNRVAALADVLAAVGAITAQTGEDVVGGLRAALAARSRIEVDSHSLAIYHRRFRGHPMRQRASGAASPPGPPRAVPIGALTDGQVDGHPVRFCLGVLLLDNGSATLTVRARIGAEIAHDHGAEHPLMAALDEITASDDRGASYQAYFSGGGGDEEWDFRFAFHAAPPASARWLDVALPGAPAVRVRLDAPPADLHITTEPVTTSAADRFLDTQTLDLLRSAHGRMARASDDEDAEPTLFWLVNHLLAAGALTPDSGSARRLAAAARQLGKHLPGQLSLVQPDALPAEWVSLQAAAKDRHDGPAGMIPVAAVLPEVDGARCVIGELISAADTATLYVHCTGWPEMGRRGLVRIGQFWWSARDNLGGLYVLEESEWSYGNGEADLGLRLSPALDPRAEALDITLTGTSRQITVTVPLDWKETL